MFSIIFLRQTVLGLIAVLTIGLFSIPLSTPTKAAPVSVNLNGTVVGGSFAGTIGTGTVNFDDSLFSGTGVETINPTDGLTLSFNIFGQTFAESDDIDFNAYPELTQEDGIFVSLDFIVSEVAGSILTSINQDGVFGFTIFDIFGNVNEGFDFEIAVDETGISVVPLPAALPLYGTGLALLGFIGWRRKRLATA